MWNAFGVFDFWMTSSGNEEYLKDYDPNMIAWIKGFPFWRTLLWAIGVFAGLLGGLALIARRRVAVLLLLVNFGLMTLGFVGHDLLLANGVGMYGELGLVGSTVLILVAGAQWLYASRAARRGYLA